MANRKVHRKDKKRTRKLSLEVEIGVLGVDSNFDEATKRVYDYRSKHVYPRLRNNGFALTLLEGSMASRAYVAKALKQGHIELFTGSGHGQRDKFMGQYYESILEVGSYTPEEVRGKIVHLLACRSAFELGEDVVRNGCKAFFGYDIDFAYHPEYEDIFLDCDSEIDIALAQGNTARQAYQRALKLYDRYIAQFDREGRDYEVATLQRNRDHLCAPDRDSRSGDPSARL